VGEGIFYFASSFFGLSIVSDAAAPLRITRLWSNSSNRARIPSWHSGRLVFASVIHSSAIPISILVILAQQNLMTLENALPIVFGANIGTAVTALLAGFVRMSTARGAPFHIFSSNFSARVSASPSFRFSSR